MPAAKLLSLALPTLGLGVLGTAILDAACHSAAAQQPAAQQPATTKATPTTPLHPVGVVASKDRISLVSHLRRGNVALDPAELRWSPTGFERSYRGGITWMGADDTTWWTMAQPSPTSQPLPDLLKMAGGVGSWVEATDRGNGRFLTVAMISGQRARVGMLDGGPTASIMLLAPTPTPHGTESRTLTRSHGFTVSGDGVPANTIPKDATALPRKAPSDDQAGTWKAELGKLRGAEVKLTWSTLLDLDRDGQDEGAVCVSGGDDEHDCYVVDDQDGQRRWYGLSTMEYGGDKDAEAPLAFQHGSGVYLMQAVPERKLLLHARWTGTDYVAASVK